MLDALAVRIVDEIRREIAAIELHALDDVQFVCQAGAFLDGDDAFLADLLHRLGDDLADLGVRVGGDAADLGDRRVVFARLGELLQLLDDSNRRLVDAALEIHRVHAGSNRLQAFTQDRLRQDRCGRRAVTGDVRRLGSDFLDHLRAHVLELVFQLDLLGDGDAVLGDCRGTKALVEHNVTALGTQGHPHRVGQDVHTGEHLLAGVVAKTYFFSSHLFLSS